MPEEGCPGCFAQTHQELNIFFSAQSRTLVTLGRIQAQGRGDVGSLWSYFETTHDVLFPSESLFRGDTAHLILQLSLVFIES